MQDRFYTTMIFAGSLQAPVKTDCGLTPDLNVKTNLSCTPVPGQLADLGESRYGKNYSELGQVGSHGSQADPQALPNFTVGQAAAHQGENLPQARTWFPPETNVFDSHGHLYRRSRT
jgi:hypothetical protein